MRYYSTERKSEAVSFKKAVLKGLAEDGGLYMPEIIPSLPPGFLEALKTLSLQEMATRVADAFFGDEIPKDTLKEIVHDTLNFSIPLKKISDQIWSLELFHGPTMAFKDVGARFMARLMSYFMKDEGRKLKVIVATSGDTGSAAAAGFFDVPGIDVYVLFPKGKVSPLQQKQITTWGKNIHALEVDGTFDDCQALAKRALNDSNLKGDFLLTSANSINIARLIPQSFYYFHGAAQWQGDHPPVFCVPSGNFGNLSAGIFARMMGLAVQKFIAATNINDVVPAYYHTQLYQPRPSVATISNAMDVGNPSNYARMMDLFDDDHTKFCENIHACGFNDEKTRETIHRVLKNHDYLLDPHGAVAFLGAEEYLQMNPETQGVIILETAHPAKFPETLKIQMDKFGQLPPQLEKVKHKEEKYTSIGNDYEALVGVIV